MKESKLVRLLQDFSDGERQMFLLFAASPYFNKNKQVYALLDYLYRFEPHFDHAALDYAGAFTAVFPNTAFNKTALIKLSSKTFQLAEQFIVHEQTKTEVIDGKLGLLKHHQERENIAFFESTQRKCADALSDAPFKNDKWAYQKLTFEHQVAAFMSLHGDDGTGDANLQNANNALDEFYLMTKLKYLCYMKNRERLVNFPFNFSLAYQMEALKEQYVQESPVLQVWWSAFQLLSEPASAQHYSHLKSLLAEHYYVFDKAEIRTLYTYLENAAKYTPGEHFAELFSLYEKQIHAGVFDNSVLLVPILYKNMVTVALRLEKIGWTEDFMQKYGPQLPAPQKEGESIQPLCLAMVAFAKHDYDQALGFLNASRSGNLYIKLEERRLRLKTFYEMGFISTFEDEVNSFRKFLSDNKKIIAAYYLTANRNFINTLFKLSRSSKDDKDRIEALALFIRSEQQLPERIWLQTKLDAL